MNKSPMRNAAVRAAVLAATMAGAGLALADYPSTIAGLSPVGYYRLNETVAVPANRITNLGTAGAAGNGYYINANETDIIHPAPGALAGDTDPGAIFASASSQYVSVRPNASNNPQGSFSVEAWVMPTTDPAGLTSPLSYAHSGDPRAGWFLYQNNVAGQGWDFRMFKHSGLDRALSIVGGEVPVAGTWYHVAVSYDAATQVARLYVNGVEQVSGTAVNYYANNDGNFTIGARSDGAFQYNGSVDEVALYDKAVPASTFLAHYQNGMNASRTTPYETLVQSSTPLLYYRLNEAAYTPPTTLPVAANTGSWGASGNAGYEAGVDAGLPSFQYSGFPAGNTAAHFNGAFGSVVIPTGQPLVTDSVTYTAWVKREGSQSGWNAVVFQRGVAKATGFGFGDNNDLRMHWDDGEYTWAPGLLIPDGVWSFIAASVSPTNTIFCVNGQFATNVVTHAAHDFSTDPIMIGQDPNNSGRIVNGNIDEVAIFDKALTSAQLTQLYNAAVVPPVITLQPQAPSGTTYEGQDVSFTVGAVGNATLTFQWRKDSVNLSGKTTANLLLSNLGTGASGAYDVVVRNGNGSVTSSVVNLTVLAGPPIISKAPVARSIYPGGKATFSVTALGSVPITYQWAHGGTPIPGATGSTLTLSELAASDAGDYTVTVTNPYGNKTATAALSVLSIPTKYESAVLSGAPVAYWRLNEASGTTAYDSQGGLDGTYTSTTTNNVPGPRPSAQNGFEAANLSYGFNGRTSDVIAPALKLNKNTVTMIAWFKPTVAAQQDWTGLVYSRGSGTVAGIAFRPGGNLGYNWNDNANAYNWDSGLLPNPDGWNFVALVVEPDKATLYCDAGSGLASAVNEIAHNAEGFNDVLHFGIDPLGNRIYEGQLDEVAIYDRSLSPAEVQAIRDAGLNGTFTPSPVTITAQPKSQEILVGGSYTLSAKATGSQPLAYQWLKDGVEVPGAIRTALSITSATVADSGSYRLRITQGANSTLSSPATFIVHPVPTTLNATNDLVLHLKFDDSYADATGRGNNGTASGSPAFVAGKIGTKAVQVSTVITGGSISAANYVSLGNPADLAIGPNQNFSIALWIKFTGNPGDLPYFGNMNGSYGGVGIDLAPSYGEGSWSWYISDINAANWTGTGLYSPVKNNMNDGQWHSLVHVFERNAEATTYLDGAKVHSISIAAGAGWDLNATTSPWVIGQAGPGADYGEAAQFTLDDIGFWRRALTEYEAMAIYIVGNANGGSFDVPAPAEVRMTFQISQGNLVIGYSNGTLQSAASAEGPYNTVNGASAPSYSTPLNSATQRFFRVRVN